MELVLGISHNDYSSSTSVGATQGYFQILHCENQLEFQSQGHKVVGNPPNKKFHDTMKTTEI